MPHPVGYAGTCMPARQPCTESPIPPPQLVAKRPVSPHVFEITGVQPHYKFPLGAVSSITNRATGCMLSVGACCGSLPCAACVPSRRAWVPPVPRPAPGATLHSTCLFSNC